MNKIKSVTVKCGACGTVNQSGIFLADVATFESATTWGNTQTCDKCGTLIHCNKENMAYVLADGSGGSVGSEYIDNVGDNK